MIDYARRLEKIEARFGTKHLQYVLAFANDGEDDEAIVADALRAHGLQPGEARVIVMSFVDPEPQPR